MADVAPHPENARQPPSGLAIVPYLVVLAVFVAVIPLALAADLSLVGSLGALVLLYAAALLVSIAIHRASARRFRPDNEGGLSALARGELERAVRLYQPWTSRGVSLVRCVARHNLASVRARQGELRGAIELLVDNEGEGGRLPRGLRCWSAVNLAMCLGLTGELELAEAWLAEAERRLDVGGPSERASAIVARAVLTCRRGKPDEAARDVERGWPDIEGRLAAFDVRSIRVLRAFMAGGGPREAGLTASFLADARPRFPGEYTWLGVDWPEMRTFLETSGLAAGG